MKKNKINLFIIIFILASFSSCNNYDSASEINLTDNWMFRSVDNQQWNSATVPGTIHIDLMRLGIIDDPFYRLNEHDVQWIDKKDWIYRTSFELTEDVLNKQNSYLEFSGLDTYAKIFLNDTLLANTNNMFRGYDIDVKDFLKLGTNKLEVLLESPIKKGIEKHDQLGYSIPVSGNDLAEIGKVEGNKRVSVFNRKAGYHFGWDWGPRLVTSGIWKHVKLKSWDQFKINDLYIQQEILDETAILNASINFTVDKDIVSKDIRADIIVDGNLVKTSAVKLKSGENNLEVPFEIKDPKLWWPNGMGEQALYNIEVRLSSDNYHATASHRIGLRTIELVREPDSIGTSFYFKVNGHSIFMKGANYIPQDVFLARPKKVNYEYILSSAQEANMNMIRVWGGGIYEKDKFYDLCDEKGLLIWQDFMFACAMYPGNKSYLENVKQEAIENVKRLRNHPSLALWCGNNEVLIAWNNWGWKDGVIKNQSKEIADTIFRSYEDIFHKILPDVVKEYDNTRSYWPSSPGSAFGETQKMESGNAHFWWVWWGKKPFDSYNDSIPRFMAEFGFQSFPEFNSVKKYTLPEDYSIYSDVMKSHQRSSIGNKTIEEYLLRDYNKPKDFENFLYVSQLLQAHGIKIGIEAHRRNRYKCMGSLYWQLNDCWPVASWSGIDYYGKWKALHYNVKDVFSNFLISHEIKNDSLEIYVISDSLIDINAKLQIDLIDFEGNKINSWGKDILANANSASLKMKISSNDYLDHTILERTFLYLTLRDFDNKILADNKIFFKSYKDLNLPEPNIEYSIAEKENHFEIILETEKFAKNVFIVVNSSNNFSDNFFDMIPNSKKRVKIQKEPNLDFKLFKKDFKIITLDQTY